ncbi:YHS domain protein [Enterovibrio norvegicus]|uniref:YHS domain-containing (seleno)protein n=1 Tax=Enterovibrio norvegicus TaxID=188144 RepID=UPI000C814CBF|nr:YHS domain-containing (seleno)protein [Enterovibrio norvegicus]MCC4798331.1 YHS domain-containing protein [Enterovibrio norvegicus]PMI33155.1 YHS domain protein [Enterovibrio norvegicus]PMN48295.1 YHS domain protein [Enterovibrio norvegicus]TKF33098.1 YHS domain-containing protein [Enterovibrio norvegicus]
MSRLLLLISLFFSSFAIASDDIYTGFFSNKAVSGYDTVSFHDGNPVEGKSSFKTEYKGADWLFSSQANLDKFLADPDKYAPQYGGYCAWAIAEKDDLAPGDPDHWKVVDGKLYLNYDNDIQNKWNADIPGFIELGDDNWAKR